jgi:predicted TIM-barrel fold metal-dependent hydrolase
VTITDAQAHIWEPETPDRPWLPGGRSFAHGDQYTVDQLLAEMAGAGVDQVVLVPPSFEGDRNDACLAAAAAYPDKFRVMGRLSLTDPESRGRLATWREQPGMLGIRLSFSRGASDGWLSDGTADWVWAEAEAAGVPIMVFAPDKLELVDGIAAAHPDLRLVLDHLGMRTDVRDERMDPVIEDLVKLARHDNVAVKVSCLASNVSESYPFPSLHDRIRRVVDAFGPRRAFWGSDITRLDCTYDEYRRLFVDELGFLSADDLEWIMGRGVREWLGWQ